MITTNAAEVINHLQSVDRKIRNRTVRRATNASGKVVLAETKRQADGIRVTGFTRRSLKSISKSKSGSTTVYIGQEKRKTFKARKTTRVKGKNLSQIQRAGKPVPIHWIERGTKAHTITAPAGKRLVFQIANKKRGNNGLAFAKSVKIPATRGKLILDRSARVSKPKAANAFLSVVKEDLNDVGK
jgi:hypothetical protein